MTDDRWIERLKDAPSEAQRRFAHLSEGAREAAAGASERIGTVYGTVRDRAATVAQEGRALAQSGAQLASSGRELGEEALQRSRQAIDKAAFHSRGLIAERPLTAVLVGVAAGAVLGVLANRLARSRAAQPEEPESEDWTG